MARNGDRSELTLVVYSVWFAGAFVESFAWNPMLLSPRVRAPLGAGFIGVRCVLTEGRAVTLVAAIYTRISRDHAGAQA
jgi:uncharacterized RDD family membrane protein YckC